MRKSASGIVAIVTLINSLAIAGCSTQYQEMGATGGVAAEQLTADTWRIKAVGNALTDPTRVADFAMLKAAETTAAAGGTHFVIVNVVEASKRYDIATGRHAGTVASGRGDVTTLITPGADVYIRVLTLQPGQRVAGAVSAAEIIQYTGPRLKRG